MLIKIYRSVISPFLAPRCRFEPTCSRYAVHALQHHGLKEGEQINHKTVNKMSSCQKIGRSFGI